jgi:pimeloyl-ACP methyl ester carboxylesterase
VLSLLLSFFATYLQAESADYIQIDESLQIYFEEQGSGQQAIVFIPGWTMSSRIFKYQLAYFKDSSQYKAIALDPRGQGLSTKPQTGYTYAQRGQDLATFINKKNLQDVVLVGWSFGTLDMLSYIEQFGITNVKAVVVLDGSPRTMSDNIENSWAWIDRLDTGLTRQSTTLAVLTNPEHFYRQFATWMLEEPTSEKITEIVGIAMQTPPYVAALTNETASYANFEDTLKSLDGKLPLYYFMRSEWASTVETWRQRNTPTAAFTHMGRHLMFWERHEEFNRYLEAFLEQL